MDISKKVKLVSSDHSIKEANISIFLANRLPDPSSFRNLFDKEFRDFFNDFKLINASTITVDEGIPNLESIQKDTNSGFRFIKADGDKVLRVLQGRNERNRAFLSFHTLDYTRWKPFIEEFFSLFSLIAKFKVDIAAKAYSLHYVDQLFWIDKEEPIDSSLIFNSKSKMLPDGFFDSENIVYSWVKRRNANEFTYIDQLGLEFDYFLEAPLITIRHSASRELKNITEISSLIDGEEFRFLLDHAHRHNKQTLKELLTPELQDLIKLHKP